MSKQDGGPAFPELEREWDSDIDSYKYSSVGGMSLRDYFAAKAMEALWSNRGLLEADLPHIEKRLTEVSKFAYAQADIMLAERDKP